MPTKLDAILWDFDGTLVNSAQKNIDITRSILSIVAPRLTGENLPGFLLSESAYHEANHAAENWRELYRRFYGLTETEIELAGSLWAEHQESNETEVQLFNGISDVINRYANIPQGICSQNARRNIWNVLRQNGIDAPFRAVVGYDDLGSDTQKPHAFGGIKCLSGMLGRPAGNLVAYIGDHEADVQFARNIEAASGDGLRVVSIAAAYSGAHPEKWSIRADHVAYRVSDLGAIIGTYT